MQGKACVECTNDVHMARASLDRVFQFRGGGSAFTSEEVLSLVDVEVCLL